MLVPGQVEKWLLVTNINKFPIMKLPLSMFKDSNKELGLNWVDYSSKSFVMNLTWMQNKACNFFLKFLDPVTRNKQVFCNRSESDELEVLVYKSQRPIEYGGTAPNVTRFWPPIMPPVTDAEYKEELNS